MRQLSKNDAAWEKLFQHYNILDMIQQAGVFQISATQINQFREARLMTKFDHKMSLPKLFRDHALCILPDSRGTYLIGQFDAYQDVASIHAPPASEPAEFPFPANLETIDHANLYSETSALLCAYNTGMIADLVGEDVRLTVMGRMSTAQFSYQVSDRRSNAGYTITVNSAQCEIDGGFEGDTKLVLIEAKNYTVDDFLIRQLYYPYRLWRSKTNKEVIPVFMTYSNDVFTFLICKFTDEVKYNSLVIVAEKTYRIASEQITLADIYTVYRETAVQTEPDTVPFPQADNFNRIVDLLGLLYESDLTQEQVTAAYQFVTRQTQYYIDACIYLGLVQKSRKGAVSYALSEVGRTILQQAAKQKYLAIAAIILQHAVFRKTIDLYWTASKPPSKSEVIEIMRHANLRAVNDTTIPRRAQTVLAWVNWILRLQRSV